MLDILVIINAFTKRERINFDNASKKLDDRINKFADKLTTNKSGNFTSNNNTQCIIRDIVNLIIKDKYIMHCIKTNTFQGRIDNLCNFLANIQNYKDNNSLNTLWEMSFETMQNASITKSKELYNELIEILHVEKTKSLHKVIFPYQNKVIFPYKNNPK